MCVESTEKLNKILENPQDIKGRRKLLEEVTLCSSCSYLNDLKSGRQPSECLIFHATEFRNRLHKIAKELEI